MADNRWRTRYPDKYEYQYEGCYYNTNLNGFSNTALIGDFASLPDTCYNIARANNSRFFALSEPSLREFTCNFSANDNNGTYPFRRYGPVMNDYTTGMENYTRSFKCVMNGSRDAYQVYRVRETQKDVDDAAAAATLAKQQASLATLNGVLNTIKLKDGSLDTIITTLNTIIGKITTYNSDANTAVENGDYHMSEASNAANSAFTVANLALQNAESARILSQDLTQQKAASDMADTAIANAKLALELYIMNSNTNILNADAQYAIVRTKKSNVDYETSGIPTIKTNAQTYYNNAKTLASDIDITGLYDYEMTTPILQVLAEIQDYTTVLQYTNKNAIYTATYSLSRGYAPLGTIKRKFDSIISRIDTDITNKKNSINVFFERANDTTQTNACNNLINQVTSLANLALSKANSIKSSTQSELLRLSGLKAIESNQQAQLAAADAIKAAALQAEYTAADEQKTKLNLQEASTRATKAQIVYDRTKVQINTINKQNSIMSRLNNNIFDINKMTTIEGFTNNTPLTTGTNQEINNYVTSFNNTMSLLDDPNNMNKAAFDTYLHIQDKKLANLNSNLNNLKKKAAENNNKNLPVKGIRSMYNSSILNVEEYPEPNNSQNSSYKGNGSSKYPNYLIYGNNGCLQYEPGNQQNAQSASFKSCNANDSRQQFNINKINNLDQYNNPITNKTNENYKINNKSNVNFGFYSVNPSVASDQCLQLNNDGISVIPCNMNSSQRFSTNYNSVV